jgi:hypothetical protein
MAFHKMLQNSCKSIIQKELKNKLTSLLCLLTCVYVRCYYNMENGNHLFPHCSTATSLWNKLQGMRILSAQRIYISFSHLKKQVLAFVKKLKFYALLSLLFSGVCFRKGMLELGTFQGHFVISVLHLGQCYFLRLSAVNCSI